MKILVTGANGFIGSRTCLYLLARHHEVVGLVRKNSNLKLLEGSGVKLVYGDITDRESLRGLFDDVEIVIHTAGAVIDWGPYSHFEKQNLEGTQNIAIEAATGGVKRMIQISSVAVHGFGKKHADENSGMMESDVAYSQSKIQTEKWLNEFANRTNMEIVIIRPGNVFGPYDEKFIAPYLDLIRKGQFVFINKGKSLTCPTYIENLVHGIELACTHPDAGGETFIITDGLDIAWKEFTDALHSELEVNPTRRSLPYYLVYFIAYLMELSYKAMRIQQAPLLTRYRINNAGRDYHFTVEKAQRILGYKPVTGFKDAVRKTIEWYNKHVNGK